MAVRLQMKLGIVAEQDRSPDSPDTMLVVEPTVGAVARSKGSLYLLVTATESSHRVAEATGLTASTIRNEYYYDESAGIAVCLGKAIRSANKRLGHLLREQPPAGGGPVGVAVAVVRAGELYVATVGPAEAYLIQQARLLTLPDPQRDEGLPSPNLEPDVWRGEFAVGDSLVLVSPNVTARLGPDELKDAMLTLHPQSAMEHLHHRFVAADGSGSDGMLALEATEVAATQRHRTLVPVHPAEPLAGAPERGPIPLADSVSDGVAAVSASAGRARVAAGGAVQRGVWRLQDLLPKRGTPYRRVTPMSARREGQRRAAIALLAFVVVVGSLGVLAYLFGGRPPDRAIDSLTAGQRALESARDNVALVFGDGRDLVTDDPARAEELLTAAYEDLSLAETSGIPGGTLQPLRAQIMSGLDRLYGLIEVPANVEYAFVPTAPAESPAPPTTGASPPPLAPVADLAALVLGPDGAPYLLDRLSKAVYRFDGRRDRMTPIVQAGQRASGATVAEPRLITVGGPDLVVVDANNVVWRWRPSDDAGRGTLTRVPVAESASWGDDIRAVGTFLRSADLGLYNLYVVDPSERQILQYAPAQDGSGFPGGPTDRLATAQDLDRVECLFIDGDIFVTQDGSITRFVGGRTVDWQPDPPPDRILRPRVHYALLGSGTNRGEGALYAYDRENARVLRVDKASGDITAQYRLADGDPGWADVRALYIVERGERPTALYWIDATRFVGTPLQAAVPAQSPAPSGSVDPAASPAGTSPSP